MNDDAILLRRYTDEGSERAFTELVQRHVDLVYGAALRRTGNAHRAAEVAQQVFTTLASNARKLARHPVLGAWLHTATRNAALNLMLSEHRRTAREHTALLLESASVAPEPEVDWSRLQPVLDAAIDELPERDRCAVVLRFLERRAFAEIGRRLEVSEDAARMRTERALDKLRLALGRRGITSTSAALATVVSTQSLIAAPPGLAASLAAAAFATPAPVVGASAFTAFFSLMKIKSLTVTVAVLLIAGTGVYFALQQENPPRASAATSVVAQTAVAAPPRIEAASPPPTIATVPAPAPATRIAAPAAPEPDTPAEKVRKQRAMMNNLRMLSQGAKQFEIENKRPPASFAEIVGPDKYVRAIERVDGEDYTFLVFGAEQVMTVTTPGGVSVTYDPSGKFTTRAEMPPPSPHLLAMIQRLAPSIERALAAYGAAHGGAKPPNSEAGAHALLPYFATPQEGADYAEYIAAMKADGRVK